MVQKEQHLVSFLLRTIRIGINATWIVVAGLAFYLLFSSGDHVDRPRFIAVLLLALAGAFVIALLPWERLLQTKLGWPALYLWSALDIVLISALIDASDRERSVLFVMYALTTVFFSASYPRVAQWALLLFTLLCYLAAAALGGWPVEFGEVILRFAVLGSLMYIVSYLSSALMEQNAELERHAELQRKTSEQLLEVQKLACLGSWTYHPGTGDFNWSEELRDIYGAPADERGISFFMQSVHPDDRHELEQALSQVGRGGAGFDIEHRILRADGKTRWIQAQGRLEEGVSPPTVLGTALDVTERKRAEEYDAKLRDLQMKRSQALQINDNIVQGITVGKYALEMGRLDIAAEALESTLAGAKEIVNDLLKGDGEAIEPGSLLRSEPAVLRRPVREPNEEEDPPSASTA